jgi:CBS domain-containing protein
MNIKIHDLMAKRVITAQPHHSVDHLHGLMERNNIHSVPIIGTEGEPVGIVSAADLTGDVTSNTPASHIMSSPVHVIPAYNDIHIAARVMRKNHVHHLVVTHEKAVIGIISSFDLLKLVEDRRFVAKNAPDQGKHKRR